MLSLDVGAILVKEPKRQTRIWKRTIQCLFDQTLDGSLPKKLPVITTSNQDGRQAKHRKKRKENLFL
jgi:hypothetical protein